MLLYIDSEKTFYYRDLICKISSFADRDAAFADEDVRRNIISLIKDEYNRVPFGCLTLDVFDTIVLRNSKSEARRFWEIAGAISKYIDPEGKNGERLQKDIFVSRVLATHASYRVRKPKNNCREGSLKDIYSGICGSLGLEQGFRQKLMEIEVQYEIENTRPNPLMWDILAFAKSTDIQVLMISDMYMHAEQIRDIVRGHFPSDVERFGDLYSSADEIVSKRSGLLFDVVREKTGFQPSEHFHIGDSVVGDFKVPKLKGWRSMLIPLTSQEVDVIRTDHDDFMKLMEHIGVDIGDLVKAGV
ncbi:hypothetical protein CO610_01630 [Lysobacteraceae bacterium NML95-0200]|nr:hypothetical protein CO610_01630 [Xanthomonadaceae bacterium NML95-0200]